MEGDEGCLNLILSVRLKADLSAMTCEVIENGSSYLEASHLMSSCLTHIPNAFV